MAANDDDGLVEALAERVAAHDTFTADVDGDAEKVCVGVDGVAQPSRDALHILPDAHRTPPRSDVHAGPADTPDGHHVVADEAPHDGGASIVAGDAADANVNTAKGAHAAALTPTHAIRDRDHVLSTAHTLE